MPSLKNKHCTKCNKIVKLPHDCNDKAKATSDKLYNKTKRQNQEFYSSTAWRKKRNQIMSQYGGLCQDCLDEGITNVADVVDHVIDLKISPQLALVDDNLRPLCHNHHNKKKSTKIHTTDYFPTIRDIKEEVIIIWGSPASGKSYYCNQIATQNDLIIDLDIIRAELLGKNIYEWKDREGLKDAIIQRNKILFSLCKAKRYNKVYFIVSSPKYNNLKHWKDQLKAKVHYMDVSESDCIKRALADKRRTPNTNIIKTWFKTSIKLGIDKTIKNDTKSNSK